MPANTFRLVTIPLLSLFILTLAGCASTDHTVTFHQRTGQSNSGRVVAAVAADHALASEAGAEILRAGGNAVDAAVATSFALSVVRPYSSGIGGGGFMIVHLAGEDEREPATYALNYRETAPSAVGPAYYESLDNPDASRTGAHAVGVPGSVAGLLYALEQWGTMDRAEVLAPAIRLAEEGFLVDAHYADAASGVIRRFNDNPDYKTRFAFTWQRLLREGELSAGDRIRLPEQAAALRLIASDGASAFYEGPIAEAIVEAIQRDGGVLSAEDLAGYQPVRTEPLRFTFNGLDILTMPPPSSGGVAMAQSMGILERLGWAEDPADPLEDPASVHLLIEAMKHAFADRARHLADPSFVDVPTGPLTSETYLDTLAARVDPDATQPPEAYGTAGALPEDGGTSHFSVVDRWGNAVACTETINTSFGSLLPVPEYGFCLNNEMDDFTTGDAPNIFGLVQADANRPEPGKRPLSSMTPTIVLDNGRVVASAGASGGPRIISGTMQVLLRMLWADQSAEEAIGRPRLHHQWSPDVLRLEGDGPSDAWPTDWREAITEYGHEIGWIDTVGNVQAIRWTEDRGWDAASDPRKGGRPAFIREDDDRRNRARDDRPESPQH